MSAQAVEAAGERVVVFGTPPPHGRDLDILAADDAADRLAASLRAQGYVSSRNSWVRFSASALEVVDLARCSSWGLSAAAEAELLARSVPLPGHTFLRRPAPPHRLLVEARRFVAGGGVLTPRSRERVAQAVAEDPAAWHEAWVAAPGWGASASLGCLEAAARGRTVSWARLRAAHVAQLRAAGRSWSDVAMSLRPRRAPRGAIVALSGLDGSGKSGQAQRLAVALERLGVETVVVWTRLGSGARLRAAAEPVRRLLRHVGTAQVDTGVPSRYAEHVGPPDVARVTRERHPWLAAGWVLVVVLDHLLEQRRGVHRHLRHGRVVVCDRWTLDSLTHLRYRYSRSTDLTVHEALLRLLAPRARASFLLAVPGEVAFARKPDQYSVEQLQLQERLYADLAQQLGVTRLDGTAPVEEIAETIAVSVWRRLRERSRWRSRARRLLRRGPVRDGR